MRRRTLLRSVAGLAVAPPAVGRVGGSEPFRPVSRLPIDGAKEVVVSPDGDTAFLAVTDGFATVGLEDPDDPVVLAVRRELLSDREDGPMRAIWDVKHDGDRLAVVGPAHSTGTVGGVLLYDVTDPSDPRQVAVHETTYPIHNAYFADETAYLTAGDRITVVDFSGDDPEPVGRWAITDAAAEWAEVPTGLRSPHDLWVRNGVAYVACWDAGTWIVDVSDPESASALGRVGGLPRGDLADLADHEVSRSAIEPPGNHHYVQPSADGSLLAVGMESWSAEDGGGGPSGIELWDVSEPTSPRLLSEIPPPRVSDESREGTWTTAHNFDLAGDTLVSSWYQGGVKLHDVSDPENPEELAWWRNPEDAAFWTAVVASEEYFVASSTAYPAPGATEGVVVFPNRPGEQTDPPSLTGTPRLGRTADTGNGSHEDGTTTPNTTETIATTDEPTRNSTTHARTTGPATPGQTGFGVPATIGSIAALTYWCVSRTGRDSDGND